jgi:hypothetical protein
MYKFVLLAFSLRIFEKNVKKLKEITLAAWLCVVHNRQYLGPAMLFSFSAL